MSVERLAKVTGFWVQQIGAFVVLLVAGHLLIGAAIAVRDVLSGHDPTIDARYRAPIYADDPDREAYWREFIRAWEGEFEPYTHWRRKAFSGRFINIDEDGVRRTPKSPLPGARKVFVFGGSTIWGTGVADADTIPALLQRRLGPRYDVTNYGESAYVSAQGLNVLLELLSKGARPNIVIFYDGVNDGYAGVYSPAIPRDPESVRQAFLKMEAKSDWSSLRALYENSNYRPLVARTQELLGLSPSTDDWDRQVAGKIDANTGRTLDAYEAVVRQVRALGRDYGFESYFFWQPNLFGGEHRYRNGFERRVLENSSPTLVASQQAVYQAAKARLSDREPERVYFLGDAFASVEGPLYIDWHHVGVAGNTIIADRMHAALTARPPAEGPPGGVKRRPS